MVIWFLSKCHGDEAASPHGPFVDRARRGYKPESFAHCAGPSPGRAEIPPDLANGIRSFVAAAIKPESGIPAMIELRHPPGMMSTFTAALACVSSGNRANLKSLVVDPSVSDRYGQKPTPITEATDPHSPFRGRSFGG
ncbi:MULTISPECIES: hypothetical protein [unclassified Streptomyces]|uniref:hypothetical protein n=1 Tax=unclassified Streptomyces TaxID=2593676 RepID=UPI0024A83BD2|nr:MULTISPECIES: hypothetical protein [unclassified Streptomyces]